MKVLNYTLAVELGKMYYSIFKITSFGANPGSASDYDQSRDNDRDNDDGKHDVPYNPDQENDKRKGVVVLGIGGAK
jgi:hypothetical protein